MLTIGVLALQGAFVEHERMLLSLSTPEQPIRVLQVRTVPQLLACDGLILPGGESTAMALVGEGSGMMQVLQTQIHQRHLPVWGTCAGCILLSNAVDGQKNGGQGLLGGIDIYTSRNFFGRQTDSFEADLQVPLLGSTPYRGVFIRAPAILRVLDKQEEKASGNSEPVQVLAEMHAKGSQVLLAVRQGNRMACVFHPELTDDTRFHRMFVDLVRESHRKADEEEKQNEDIEDVVDRWVITTPHA
jgi:5'-phosphate synthase pdxT subunit